MSIRRLSLVLFLFLLATLFTLIGSLGALVWTQTKITGAEERRFRSIQLADELRQSSDDLTRMARLYVVTRDEHYKAAFHEILGIRNGKSPRPLRYDLVYWDLVGADGQRPRPAGKATALEGLMIQEGFTLEEFRKLEDAKDLSDELVRLEETAMHAVEGRFLDEAGRFTREAEADPELARTLMFGPQYMEAKAQIMAPINEFLQMLEDRTGAEVAKYRSRGRVLGALALAMGVAAVLIATLMLLVQRRRLLGPLAQVHASAEAVATGHFDRPIEHESSDEMGQLVGTFNSMLRSTRDSIEALHRRNDELQVARLRSDELLLNIIPAAIAGRIKSGETSIADEFPSVTVLFADLVGFTQLTDRLGPHEIVHVLGEIFGLFDARLAHHRVEKIKTIGDCYMAAGGVPEAAADHARQTADFAIGIKEDFGKWAEGSGLDLQIRIGMHSGTAVAGIVGTHRFAYDIWGDVVNVASRMESTGRPGEIQVSDPTYVQLKDLYEFEKIAAVEVKGKGRMQTWLLRGRRYVT
ncbi:MAG: adenylate/guanylate cyclase domain-containing protein [Polyangiales bacterium]